MVEYVHGKDEVVGSSPTVGSDKEINMSLGSVPFWRCCKECDRRRAGGRVYKLSKWRRGKLKRETQKEIRDYE